MSIALEIFTGVALVLVVTAATGWFVAQEFAYMAVDRNGLQARTTAGDSAASRALQITSRTSFMLSGAQLGITVTGLIAGYVAEPLIGSGISDLLGATAPAGLGVAVGSALALVFVTVVQMVLGELVPKNWAIARPDVVARWLALSTSLYLKVFGPVIRFFDQSAIVLLRAVRIEPVEDVRHAATPGDLERILEQSRDSGDLPPDLSMLLDRSLDFTDAPVEHAMIPRTHVVTISVKATVEDAIAVMAEGHSRLPVLGQQVDDVVGVLELRDLLNLPPEAGTTQVGQLVREPVLIPTFVHLPHALAQLHDANEQFACIVDEYGGLAGILTVEDIAEELVGEIADEHDHEVDSDVQPVGDQAWLVPGHYRVDEVERLLGRRLPEGRYESIGGLILNRLGRLPELGEQLQFVLERHPDAAEGEPAWIVNLRVETVGQRVPRTVRVSLRQAGEGDVNPASNESGSDSSRGESQ